MTAAATTRPPPVPRAYHAGAPVVVLAEDDLAVQDILVKALGRTYTVYAASDGNEAVDLISRLPAPSAFLLDVMMPGKDGLTIARMLHADPTRSGVPVLLLTALGSPKDVISGINVGVRHYVTKPFKLADVLSKVERAVAKKK